MEPVHNCLSAKEQEEEAGRWPDWVVSGWTLAGVRAQEQIVEGR